MKLCLPMTEKDTQTLLLYIIHTPVPEIPFMGKKKLNNTQQTT